MLCVQIKDGWGWVLWNVAAWKEADVGPGKEADFVKERYVYILASDYFVNSNTNLVFRVHCRVYKSTNV